MLNEVLNEAHNETPDTIRTKNGRREDPYRKKFATFAIFNKKASIMQFHSLFA